MKAIKLRPTALALIIIGVLFLVVPLLTSSNYMISTIVTCFIFASFGVAWNLIGGYGAQISWCHAAFVAIGAYSNFILFIHFGVSPFITMFLGAGISFLIATAIGMGTFRLRGSYFSIATIAFAEILRICLQYFSGLTGGSSGLYIPYTGASFFNLQFQNDTPFYYITFGLLVLVVLFTYQFERSKTGYYLGAIKGDEDAAASLGIETFKVKLTAFQLSAVITSVVGSVYASYLTYVEPLSICGMDLSIKIGVVAIIGGVGTLMGPVLGAFIIIPLIELAMMLLGERGGSQMIYGLALVVIVILRPSGLITLLDRFKKSDAKLLTKPLEGVMGK